MWRRKFLACSLLLSLATACARGQGDPGQPGDPLAVDVTFEVRDKLLKQFFGKEPTMEKDSSERIAEVCFRHAGYWNFRGVENGAKQLNPRLELWLLRVRGSSVELRIKCKAEISVEVIRPGDKELLTEDGQFPVGNAWPKLIAGRLDRLLASPQQKLVSEHLLPFLAETAPLCTDVKPVPRLSWIVGVLPLALKNGKFEKLRDLGKSCFRIRGTLNKREIWLYSEGTDTTTGYPPNALFQGIVVRHVEWEDPANARGAITPKLGAQLAGLQKTEVFLDPARNRKSDKATGPVMAPP